MGLLPDNLGYVRAQTALYTSHWLHELQQFQHSDGTWGRFHSRNSALKQIFPTTEIAISRALALGLDKNSLVLQAATGFMLKHLAGEVDWSDPPEKHEGWPVNIRFITAGTLARVDSQQPALEESCQKWIGIVERTFRSGAYNPQDERLAHLYINGIRTKGKYLKLAALYPLLLLSSSLINLTESLEKSFLKWIWNKEGGIYYVYSSCLNDIPALDANHFCGWLEALELLSRFNSWRTFTRQAVEWLWNQKDDQGLWDFSPRARSSVYFPLSESWRNMLDRKIDCSIRILSLLRRYTNDNNANSSF